MKRVTRSLALATMLAFVAPAAANAGADDPGDTPVAKKRAKPADKSASKTSKRSKRSKAKTSKATAKSSKSTAKKKEKFFDFLADDVEGNGILPGGELSTVVGPAEHGSLIRYRTHFVPQIIKWAEDL